MSGRITNPQTIAQIVKFVLVGMLNTAFGYGIFAILILSGLMYPLALLIATVAGVVFNFFSFGSLVFRDARATRLPSFLATYGVIYLLNLGMLSVQIHLGVPTLLAQAVCMVVIVPITFALLRVLVFNGAEPE